MVASSIIGLKATEKSRLNETGALWRHTVKAVMT
jgi:hypothetical protein